MTTGNPELDRVIDAAVDDGSIFSDSHRRRPPHVVGSGDDIVGEVRIRLLLPEGAGAVDAVNARLGLELDVLLANCRLESARLHLDRETPLGSFAEIVLRPKQLAIGESP